MRVSITHDLPLNTGTVREQRLPRRSFMSREQKWAQRPWRSLSYTCFTPPIYPQTFEPLSHAWTLLSFLSWQPDHLFSLLWKKPTHLANQPPLLACWTQPILPNLARIFHLHKAGWIEDNTCSLSLYKPCLSLFLLEHYLGFYVNQCFLNRYSSGSQINTWCLSPWLLLLG